jgi:NAD(P)-dependent dehydrogenase (short-subunit alcohol dehydrogenase family)
MNEASNDDRSCLLAGKVALVVGASRGIGAVSARALARAGAKVMLAARDAKALETVVGGIRRGGHEAHFVTVDIADESSVAHLIKCVLDRFGRLDVAFNNATDGSSPQPLADTDIEDFDRAIRTNIRGTFLGMKHQIPALLATGGGSIINMAPLTGVQGVANLAGYVTGKAGVIAPGPILTHHLEAAGEQAQRHAALGTPMRRVGTSEEIADAVLWLASDQSSFITGVTLPIDGGQSAGSKPERMFRTADKPNNSETRS